MGQSSAGSRGQYGSGATQTSSTSVVPPGQATTTVTVSVTGQTTIIQGQTVTVTQNDGVVTVTHFENGTVTVQGPTVTAQGSTVTAQGPTVTAQGPTVTAQGPTVTVEGPTVTAQAPTVTVEGPTVTAQGPTITAQAPTITAQGPTVTAQGPTQTVTTIYGQGSTVLPNCPYERPGRVFDSPYGGEYAIYCGYAYLDPDCSVVTSSSLGSCVQACDAYNIQHFNDPTNCVGVTYFNGTGECHLKSSMTMPHATDGVNSAQLLNPYQGGVTQVFASTSYMGSMGPGPTVTYASPVAGYTQEPLVNCPQDNNTVVTAGSNNEAFLIECGINRAGSNLPDTPYFVSSFRSCIDACANDQRCYDTTFFPGAAMSPCYLHANITNATRDASAWNARLLTGPTCPRDDGKLYITGNEDFVVECYTDRPGCDFAGMPLHTDSLGACMDICAANAPQCVDVSWIPGSPQGSCTLKSCAGAPITNQTDVWGGRLLNGTGENGRTVTTVQTVATTVVQTEFQTILLSITTTLTLTTTSSGVPVTLTSTQTLVSTQTAPTATQTVTTDRLVTTTLISGGGGSGGNGTNGYPNATATVTTTVGSGYITVTVTAVPSSSSSTFSCLTHMTNYLPASASGGFRARRNEFIFQSLRYGGGRR